jgi:hypothetical protein
LERKNIPFGSEINQFLNDAWPGGRVGSIRHPSFVIHFLPVERNSRTILPGSSNVA